jgi:hypothetical protein
LKYRAWSTVITMYFWPSFSDMCMHRWTTVYGSGLHEIWVESELLGLIAAEQVLYGKHYNRGMRAHNITSQAVWWLLLPPLLEFLKDSDCICKIDCSPSCVVSMVVSENHGSIHRKA